MSELFSGLEKLGLSNIKEMDIFEKEEEKKVERNVQKKVVHELEENEMLFDKTYRCPVCDRDFKSKCVMAGKAKLIGTDTDLRPRYQGIDCTKYDVVVCNNCGYAATARFFNTISNAQGKLIKENISNSYQPLEIKGDIYTYDEAILRYQLSLANTVVKRGKISERAYTCLKIAWLYRGKAESLDMEDVEYVAKSTELKEQEQSFIESAYKGFVAAMSKEMFPICGMDESTYTYVTADLARRCKDYETSAKLISQIVTSRTASSKVKDRARELKEIIKSELKG
jgi:hypothetical protein